MPSRLALVWLVALSACSSSTAPTVRLHEEFVLAPGQTAAVAGTGVRIRFVGVDGDSRCPADVLCILGGDAVVRIEVLSFGAAVKVHELHTGDLRPVTHGSLTIALVQLAPYPFSSRTIRPDEYRATLRVTD